MNRSTIKGLLLAACLAGTGLCHAAVPPAHLVPESGCAAPERPADKQDADRWNAFVDAVDVYRACISRYVDANQAAAADHSAAAQTAAESWNHFVRDSLNAPEDYPWPPKP